MIRFVFAVVCTTILAAAAAVVGLTLLPSATALWTGLSIGCAVCVAVICVVNLIAESRRVDRMLKMTERQRRDYGLRLKEEIERDYRAAERRVELAIAGGYAYIALFILLCMAGIAFVSAMGSTGFAVVFAVFILGLLVRLTAKKEEPFPQLVFSEQDYPRLYALARRAQAAVGGKKKIVINWDDEPLTVFETRDFICIGLSWIFYAISTDEELYAALMHEFAHVKNRDTRRGRRFMRLKQMWEREENLGSSLFVSAVASLICWKMDAYEWISMRYHEVAADRQVRGSGAEQAFVNAVAKMEELSIYFNMFRRETLYDCFASETPIADYAAKELATYEEYRVKQAEIWKQILSRRLSALLDSHPSLRQRMQALGVESFDASQRETDANACSERKKMLAHADNLYYQNFSEDYGELRQEEYLKPKAIMEGYLKAEAEHETLSLSALSDCPAAFYGIDNERAEKIARELISNNYFAAIGHDVLGKLYYHRLDERCMDEFRAEMSLAPDAWEQSLEYMRNYVLRTGDEEYIRRFGEEAPELAQRAKDRVQAGHWKAKKQPLRKSALADEYIQELCRRAEECGGLVRRMYVADYGEEITVTLVVLEVSVPVRSEEWDNVFGKMSGYLDAFAILSSFYDLRGKNIARALEKGKIEPVWEQ